MYFVSAWLILQNMPKGWSQIAVRKEDQVNGVETIEEYKKKAHGKITHAEIYRYGISWFRRLLKRLGDR